MKRTLSHTLRAAVATAITVGCIIAISAAAAQHAAALTPSAQDGGSVPLKGYVRTIAGDRLDYMCFNPLASAALLTRCTTGDMNIEWETEAVPTKASGQYVEFTWIVSYSTVTSAANTSRLRVQAASPPPPHLLGLARRAGRPRSASRP